MAGQHPPTHKVKALSLQLRLRLPPVLALKLCLSSLSPHMFLRLNERHPTPPPPVPVRAVKQAVTLISPVYVAAIKRGGGVLVSSLIGVTLFGESVHGRLPPILAIAAGVVLLCLK